MEMPKVLLATDQLNQKLVTDGLTPDLEKYFPLIEVRYAANDYNVYFFGHCIWDSMNDADVAHLPLEIVEKRLEKRIDEVRRLMNHVTSSIPTHAMALV